MGSRKAARLSNCIEQHLYLTVTTHYAIIGSKVTSMRAEDAQGATQLGPGEAKLLGWGDFLKIAKCKKGHGPVRKLNGVHTLSIL